MAIVLVLSTVFVIFGGGLFGNILYRVYGCWRTRAGVTVEARLRTVEWRSQGSSKGTSRWTEASYDYEVDGQHFTGSRLALFKTTARYYHPLRQAMDMQQPIRVFIDPSDARFAVIDREFAWFPFVIAVPFSLGFFGCGLFLGWCLRQNFLGKTVPDQPFHPPVRKTSRAERKPADATRQNS